MRNSALVAAFLIVALVLAACGGGTTPPPAEPTAPAAEPTAAQTEPTAGGGGQAPATGERPDDPLGVVEIGPNDPIVLAWAMVVSGPNESLGVDSRRGMEIAVDDLGGELLGHPIELTGEDTGCSPEGGQAAASKLASNPQIVAIVGTSCSSEARVLAPVVAEAGMVIVSPSNTAPDLTDPATRAPGYFRTAHNDTVQGRAAAEFAIEQGIRSAATIHDGSVYAEQLANVFAESFEELGGEIVAQEAVNVGDTDMRPVLTRIASAQPELIYYPIFVAEGGFITRQAREVSGLEEVALMGADGMFSPDFLEAAGEAAEGMYHSSPDFSAFGDQYQGFLQKHQEKYGEEPLSAFHAHAYDATMMIAKAIEQVAVQGADGTLWIGRQALRDAVAATANFPGLTGNLTCDENGDCADPKIAVYQTVDPDPAAWNPGAAEDSNPKKIWPEATTSQAPSGDLMVVSAPDCDYGGILREIAAIDELTVRFTMCRPDPAFPAKAAFVVFGIQPSEHLEATGGSPLDNPIGTGPYMLESWNRGDSIVFQRFDDYWGEPANAQTLVFRWSAEAAQRLLELQSGTVDGIDNPGPDDFETIEADPNLQLLPRPGLNVFYVGMNNNYPPFDDERVRQAIAMGIDRQRIVDNFYPPGSEVATHFAPCSIPNGCVGEEWYEFNPERARELLAEAGYPDGFETVINYRDVVRSYLPEPGVVAQDIQAQLQENLNITAEIEVMESGAFLAAADAGELEGLHLLGWGADYPDMTNFLDYHFGEGASAQFGEKFPDITAALKEAAALADDEERAPFYEEANNLIKQHVPMVPVAHGGSATVFQADVEGAHASPLNDEYFAVMNPGGRDTIVWMQNAEPISLYCADETDGESLRACVQVIEPLLRYEVGGTSVEPALAESCEPNDDLTEWTCTLREGVKFHDGSDLDANDVVMSYAVQWDASHPLHTGNTGAFTYFEALWGGLLNASQ